MATKMGAVFCEATNLMQFNGHVMPLLRHNDVILEH